MQSRGLMAINGVAIRFFNFENNIIFFLIAKFSKIGRAVNSPIKDLIALIKVLSEHLWCHTNRLRK